eukprot:scaffold300894_cov23-Tisochrysis_lutea.AAC.1
MRLFQLECRTWCCTCCDARGDALVVVDVVMHLWWCTWCCTCCGTRGDALVVMHMVLDLWWCPWCCTYGGAYCAALVRLAGWTAVLESGDENKTRKRMPGNGHVLVHSHIAEVCSAKAVRPPCRYHWCSTAKGYCTASLQAT